uniref:Plastocyanin n=1 Tax=Prasinoderma coloniale TaxID=156133 RepID=A0A7R9TJ67_9VIRI|mmetsp:Transcript_1856/g.7460  ORF Transcript_1856/g.7460 Transcript_1856/m.7460 type:complete len:149 (+) Transcript_1856:64-510(+)
MAAVARASFKATAAPKAVRAKATMAAPVNKAASFAAGAAASVLLAATPAMAASVKLGSDSGALVFDPATVTISKGDSVTWTNNAGFPHNVVFDEDAVPDGVDVDSLSSYDLLNAPGESHSATFDVAGTYEYYCEPHQGAGMAGKVVVN